MDQPYRMERSLGELFSDLSEQVGDLVRQELRLAKLELSKKVTDASRSVVLIVAGGAFALAAVVMFASTVALLLIAAGVMPWMAALLTTFAMACTAYLLAQAGLSALKNKSIAPVETIHSLKETTQWLKSHSTR